MWILLLLASAHALHFYLDAETAKCFTEELPADTMVLGTPLLFLTIRKVQIGAVQCKFVRRESKELGGYSRSYSTAL